MTVQNNTTPQVEDWKRELCEVFFARSGIIWSVTFMIFVLAALIAFLWPPTYEASGSLLMHSRKSPSSPTSLVESDVRVFDLSEEDIASELEILTSPELVRQTLQKLQGVQSGSTDSMGDRVAKIMAGDPEEEDALTSEVRKARRKLKTEIIPASRVFKMGYRDRSASRSEQFLDELLRQYVLFRNAKLNPLAQEDFLSQRTEDYRRKLEELEDQLIETAKVGSLASVEQEMSSNVELKRELLTQLAGLRDSYVASKFLADDELVARMKMFSIQIQELEDRNQELQSTSVRIRRVERELELLEYSYETFARRAEQARIDRDVAASSLSSDVTVLSGAAMSAVQIFPRRILTLLLGLVVGFITGCSLGFMVEFLDHTFRRPEDVERYAGLPVVFSISRH